MEKKKIGILTFHNADNLGAVLQAYALQTAIEQMNDTVEIIDYRCQEIENSKKIRLSKNPKKWIKELFFGVHRSIKKTRFSEFRKKYLKCSPKKYTQENIVEANERYDIVIAGSDQIWNLACSGYDETYLLGFIKDKQKCFSYAASIGLYQYSAPEAERITEYLSCFAGISVRESDAQETLMAMNICAQVHPDPVFLLTGDQWCNLIRRRIYPKPYVLVYMIEQDYNLLGKAKEYARIHNCDVVSNKRSLEFILHNSPAEFLSWVYYAECVFTNSFHGSAFSCIFNKPLAAKIEHINGSVNGRILNLLSYSGTKQCILSEEQGEPAVPNMENRLPQLRDAGLEYLQKVCAP